MAKKPKNPLKDADQDNGSRPNETSNSSTIFKALFGEIPEQILTSDSIFSESNPFRRELLEKKQKGESRLGVSGEDGENEGNLGKPDISEMPPKIKRKKDKVKKESSDLEKELVEEKSKKSKRDGLKVDAKSSNNNLSYELKESLENDAGRAPGDGESGNFGVKSDKKKKKRKRDEVETEYEARRYGVADTMNEAKGESGVLGEKRKKMDNPEDMMVSKEGFDDESKLLRTVFVGNLPLKLKKKEIAKEFAKFGEVESVRIRSVPLADGKIPRKGAVIKKRINENGDSVHAYVVFKTEESAQASLAHNMAVVGGNHIRVDRACPPRKKLKGDDTPLYDNKRTVFVGNLPFDVKDEEIYKLFSGIKNLETSIEAVRVIRDPGSSLGKGIAYVLFKTTGHSHMLDMAMDSHDAANLIVKKRNLKLRDRELRLSHAKSTTSNTSLKRKSPLQPLTKNTRPAKKFASVPTTPDSCKASLSYQGLRASKSGSQKKKVLPKVINSHGKSKTRPDSDQSSVKKKKRPAVAARKQKALKAAANASSQVVGTKRKIGKQTPASGGQKKKARKFRCKSKFERETNIVQGKALLISFICSDIFLSRRMENEGAANGGVRNREKSGKFPLTAWEVTVASGVVLGFSFGLVGLYLTMPASDYSFLKLPRSLQDLQILRDNLESYTSDYTVQVLVGYCLVYIFMQTFMIPGTVFMSLLAGALFGIFKGVALVVFTATAGASSCFFLSKIVGRPLVFSLWPEKLAFFQSQVAKRRERLLNYMLFLRVTPTLPNTFLNVASPIVDVPYHIFFLATFIGIIPAAYVTVRAGITLGELQSVGDLYDFQSIATLFLIGVVTVTPTLMGKGKGKSFLSQHSVIALKINMYRCFLWRRVIAFKLYYIVQVVGLNICLILKLLDQVECEHSEGKVIDFHKSLLDLWRMMGIVFMLQSMLIFPNHDIRRANCNS
ncbi:RNA-binding (RRM/RBD/RNP motifs) family protein [Striga asiatica]|uniref:RNA-binding (RRM/RBD/RNP motifs) family protein n=1 Tax=Striga asiatica TaxID=4170 RepID=A0A5A7R2N8_STRAF|nr:RNA-binding (RRM/RBD/RNP motifs) family protein [Striga asiatica]